MAVFLDQMTDTNSQCGDSVELVAFDGTSPYQVHYDFKITDMTPRVLFTDSKAKH